MIYAVMTFDTELNLGISNKPNQWVNIKNYYFNDKLEALYFYINNNTQAAELIVAEDTYELKTRIGQMILNYKNENWLNDNLYNIN